MVKKKSLNNTEEEITSELENEGEKVKGGIENSVRNESCPLTRVSSSGELTVLRGKTEMNSVNEKNIQVNTFLQIALTLYLQFIVATPLGYELKEYRCDSRNYSAV